MMGGRVRIRYPRRCPRSLLPRWPWPTTPDRKQTLKVTLVNLLVTKATISNVSGSLDLKEPPVPFSKGIMKSKNWLVVVPFLWKTPNQRTAGSGYFQTTYIKSCVVIWNLEPLIDFGSLNNSESKEQGVLVISNALKNLRFSWKSLWFYDSS